MTAEVIRTAAALYRRRGPAGVGIPLSTFPDGLDSVIALLDSGDLERHERGVALAPSVRLALAGQSVVAGWLEVAAAVPGLAATEALTAVRKELRTITTWAAGQRLPDELAGRAAELAGVLAMHDLDPEAMAVVAASGGEPQRQLAQLRALGEGSCRTLKELRTAISRFVSTIYQER